MKRGMPSLLSDSDVTELVAELNEIHRTSFTVVRRFRGGEGPGAYELATPDRTAVLKVFPGDRVERLERTAALTVDLTDRGYPAPRIEAIGRRGEITYAVQERLPGDPLGARLNASHLDEIFRLNDLQSIPSPALMSEWPGTVADVVLHGGDGFGLIETMRAYSAETDELITLLQQIVRSNAHAIDACDDITHLDFTSSNILGDEHEITGVIDWEGACAGDRAFDLVALQFYVFEDETVRAPLWSRALELSGVAGLKVYFSHIIHRQVEWSVRFHTAETVESYLGRARSVIDALAAL
jgi:aminoglycoside phosphotransferase (APT) family kinase protein